MAKRRARRRKVNGGVQRRRKPAGLPPGTPIYTGSLSDVGVTVDVMEWRDDTLVEVRCTDLSQLAAHRDTDPVTWISVTGLHDVALVQRVCETFGVHPLAVEDIVSTSSRAKFEEYPDHLYIVIKMLWPGDAEGEDSGVGRVISDHASVLVGHRTVITFQERPSPILDPIRRRIREAVGRLRTSGPDYLAYALLDTIVDHYFLVLDDLRARAEALEDALLNGTNDGDLSAVYELRRELVFLRKQLWPLRDGMLQLLRHEGPHLSEATRPFLRDLVDHVQQAADTVDMYRDMVKGMIDLQMNLITSNTNDVMVHLTVIATIFIPLTFIVGVYGMNFTHMPELEWRFGYLGVWVVMVSVAGGMLAWFRRRGWL